MFIMVPPGNNTAKNVLRSSQNSQNQFAPQRAEDLGERFTFPRQQITAEGLREILHEGSLEERAAAISNLLSFAPWNHIWALVSPDEVREIFPHLELPTGLRRAWARLLQVP